MSGIVERVATAIDNLYKAPPRGGILSNADIARVAIAAMREPMPEMICAILVATNMKVIEHGDVAVTWRAAIDEALK